MSERSALRCRWEGIDIPVHRTARRQLAYVPPLRPRRTVVIDTLTDPSGRTVRIELRTMVPDLPRACGLEAPDPQAQELSAARPVLSGAATVALVDPLASEACVLARAGEQLELGSEVVLRAVLPSAEAARAYVRAVRAPGGDLRVRVRYRAPAPTDVGAIETEHLASSRSCAESCAGCCSAAGDCIADEGGDPSACASPVRVTIERVRLTSGHCGPVDGQCDYVVVIGRPGASPVTHGLGDGRNDARTELEVAEGLARAIVDSPTSIRVLDDDEYVDDELGACSVALSRAQVLAAITTRDGVRLDVECGQVTLTVRAGIRRARRAR